MLFRSLRTFGGKGTRRGGAARILGAGLRGRSRRGGDHHQVGRAVCRAQWLAEGVHVNVAGANSDDRREVDAETVLRAAVKATDHVEQAKVEAGEFRELVAAGKLAWSAIRELGEFVTGKATGRTSPSDLTLFKSLGIALEDVAFAELVYQRALAAGVGRPIPI